MEFRKSTLEGVEIEGIGILKPYSFINFLFYFLLCKAGRKKGFLEEKGQRI